MKIPAIFHYKTESDHKDLEHLKEFLKDSVKVYELASVDKHDPIPSWRFILVELIDGKYLLRVVDSSPNKMNYIDAYYDDSIREGLEDDDIDDIEMVEGEIREIIVVIGQDYFPSE
jgi:hypothetical protein